MVVCLTHKLAERYLSGDCSDDEQQAIESHLTTCQSCRQQVASTQSKIPASNKPDLPCPDDKNVAYRNNENPPICADQDEFSTRSILPDASFHHRSRPPVTPAESMIEGYEILEQLPLGAQAVVYKAIQKATKRIVALKVLLKTPQESMRAQYRFEREIDLAASLQHPNIVTIYDSGIIKNQYYFAMQYIEGKPLDKYILSNNLSVHQIMELFNKICSAVAYAHQRGVIHRDLKPDNILIDNDNQPHVLDFGLAKLVDSSEQTSPDMLMTSIPGEIVGTLAFMSPEQASAQPDTVDVRTDVYSIGMILYKILTGKFPYEVKGSMLSILRNIQEAEPTRPSKIIRRFNSELEAILLKVLEKDLSRRYQSAAHLQHDIDYWLKGLPIEAKADSSIYLLRKIITRHYYASAVVALLIIIICGFSYFCFQLYTKLRKTNITLESTIQSLNKDVAQDVVYDNLARQENFIDFLEAWHKNQLTNSQFVSKYFKGRSREVKAAIFLLKPSPLDEKITEFRNNMGHDESCFVEYVIAEHYLKNGNHEEAIINYRKCLLYETNLPKDRWLESLVKKRLYELTNEKQQGKALPGINN